MTSVTTIQVERGLTVTKVAQPLRKKITKPRTDTQAANVFKMRIKSQ